MATVYSGRHEVDNSVVAIKVLNADYVKSASVRRRFLNEARAGASLRHPGIARSFDFGFSAGANAYIVMEMLHGESLADRLRRGPLTERELRHFGMQLSAALDYAHRSGVVHRDIKPENIFLVGDPSRPAGTLLKILDFGIAKHQWSASTTNATAACSMLGTPAYMSPEQCRDPGSVDSRTDIYSLGVVLFKMATGSLPFPGASAGEFIAQHQYMLPPAPTLLAPQLSGELSELIVSCLAKPVKRRPQDMALVYAKLCLNDGSELDATDVRVPTCSITPSEVMWGSDEPASYGGTTEKGTSASVSVVTLAVGRGRSTGAATVASPRPRRASTLHAIVADLSQVHNKVRASTFVTKSLALMLAVGAVYAASFYTAGVDSDLPVAASGSRTVLAADDVVVTPTEPGQPEQSAAEVQLVHATREAAPPRETSMPPEQALSIQGKGKAPLRRTPRKVADKKSRAKAPPRRDFGDVEIPIMR